MERRRFSPVSLVAFAVAAMAHIALFGAPAGTAAGTWDFRTGFNVLRWAVYLGGGALLLGGIALVQALTRSDGRSAVLAVLAIIVAAAAAGMPLGQYRLARLVPPINDITTDTASPPDFVAAGQGAENGAAGAPYPGEDFARQQREAYPDLATLHFTRPADEVFAAALAAARAMRGWDVVLADEVAGRIEAVATTRWFRFVDDVAIRVRPAGNGIAVDVRSRSRVGKSDVGANAARIRAFSARLKERLGS